MGMQQLRWCGWILVFCAVSLAGCVETASVTCGNIVCPLTTGCSADNLRCLDQAQLDACAQEADGTPCSYQGVSGACFNGYCVDTDCGNRELDLGEVCDDGNVANGDGCSSDCRSTEICGNGIVDVGRDETCDEGATNSDAPDATCRTNCRAQRCGDSVIDTAAGEQCDGTTASTSCVTLGYYSGVLGCTNACQNDTSQCLGKCGDGLVEPTTGEQCDGTEFGGETCQSLGFCRGANPQAGTVAETVVIEPATTATELYFVVDGYQNALSGYTLSVACEKQ